MPEYPICQGDPSEGTRAGVTAPRLLVVDPREVEARPDDPAGVVLPEPGAPAWDEGGTGSTENSAGFQHSGRPRAHGATPLQNRLAEHPCPTCPLAKLPVRPAHTERRTCDRFQVGIALSLGEFP